MKEIPREYLLPCEEAGRLEKLEIEGYPDAQVYVPAGYDAETGREYPVFFLLHGGGGDP